MSEEELCREIKSGAFSMQVADCERNIRIQFEQLQQENQKLKKQLEEYILITIDYQELEARNQKLKKQLEEANEKILLLQASEPMLNYKKALEENQQKEFINYMNDVIDVLKKEDVDDEELRGYIIQRIDTFKEILSKYRSIIGGKE